MSKIPLSFHYTGWLIEIPLLDYYTPSKLGSIIPYNHQPTGVLNTAHICIRRIEWFSVVAHQRGQTLSTSGNKLTYSYIDTYINIGTCM